jgi:hypothetical protein
MNYTTLGSTWVHSPTNGVEDFLQAREEPCFETPIYALSDLGTDAMSK